MATQAEFGRHVGISQQSVAQLVDRGIVHQDGRGGIDIDAARLAYCAHLRDKAGGRVQEDDADLTAERTRKTKEEADALEMKNAQLRGELLAREDVTAAVQGAFARVRARMIGLPTKVAPLVSTLTEPAECEGAIRKAVHDALRELSETSVASLCGDNGDLVEDPCAAAGSDGEPVGGREAAPKPRGKRRAGKVGHGPG